MALRFLSPRRRPGSIASWVWIPAFAGMTLLLCACGVKRDLVRPSEISQEQQQDEAR